MAADGCGGAPPGPRRCPFPPGPGDVPAPAGTPGNLKVLDWAGFKSAVSYTFDDAQPSQIEHYADLQATGVRHHLLHHEQQQHRHRRLRRDLHAGGEGRPRDGQPHRAPLPRQSRAAAATPSGAPASVDAELDDCNSYIASHFGQSAVWTAASPYGDTGWDAADMARFFLNRGVGSGTVAPDDNTDPFNLPCHAAVEGETVAMLQHRDRRRPSARAAG